MRTKMKLILDTGQLMMENGAGSKRIVRDMLRTAAYLGIYWENTQIHVTYTTIMLNVDDGHESYTMFRKCYRHGINMWAILETSDLSLQALSHNYSYEVYQNELAFIRKKSTGRMYPEWLVMLGIGLASGAFCTQFGGTAFDALYTVLAAIVGAIVRYYALKIEMNTHLCVAASAFASTLAAYVSEFLPGAGASWLPMMACALTLIPGVPLINAVDDFLNNYLTSGLTRMTNTVLVMLAMTFGITAAVALSHVPDFTERGIAPEALYVSQALAAAIAAIGFSVMFNVPKRYFTMAIIGAIITVDCRNILMVHFDAGMATASFIGASFCSVVFFCSSRWLHAPLYVISIPAVIPLIPGVLLYRFLFAVIGIHELNGEEFLRGMQNGVEAGLVLLGIAIGATLPEVIGHFYLERKRRRRLFQLLAQRQNENPIDPEKSEIDKAEERN